MISKLREENRDLRKGMEQRLIEMAALAERLDMVALAYSARDQTWLAELDIVGREFEDARRQLLAVSTQRDALVGASAAQQAAPESEFAEAAQGRAKQASLADEPLPRWRPKILPFRSLQAVQAQPPHGSAKF
jgi:BMFP domain-containing protein YqiC